MIGAWRGWHGYSAAMLARLGEVLSRVFRATAPDPLVIAILLTAATLVLGWLGMGAPVTKMVEYWQAGLWDLLTFGMQMCLILVTGHALASSPPVARGLRRVVRLARGPRSAIAITSVVAMLAALVNWGFGLIVGAILSRDMTRELRSRGGYNILVIEHDMGLVEGISDRVIALDYGQKIAEGGFHAVATDERVVEAYLGRKQSPLSVVTGQLHAVKNDEQRTRDKGQGTKDSP